MMLEHFKYPEQFLRKTKHAFVSIVDDSITVTKTINIVASETAEAIDLVHISKSSLNL